MTMHTNGASATHGRVNYIAEAVKATLPAPKLNAVTLDTVAPETVDWLWPGRLPYAKLWLLDGHPGTGKSFVTLELAACVTTGRALPGGRTMTPADVIVVNLEDGTADTLRPRAEAAGADLRRLHAVTSVTDSEGNERAPRLPDDVPLIRELVQRTGARLVIVDPITAYLGADTDTHKDADVRRALLPLARLADELDVAVLVVRHLRKRSDGVAILAGAGSMGFIGIARGGLLLAKDPDDPTRRVLAVSKNNLAPEAPAMTFSIADDGHGPRIRWQGDSVHTADELVAAMCDQEQRSAVDEAVELLRAWLEGGPLERKAVLKLARDAGFSEATIDRAKKKLGIVSKQEGFGLEKRAVWSLPVGANSLRSDGVDGNGGARGGKSLHDNAPTFLSHSLTEMGASDELTGIANRSEIATAVTAIDTGTGEHFEEFEV